MKTTSHLRMYIVVAMMTATACSEPEIVPTTQAPKNQIPREFHTGVTTWNWLQDGNYVGFVSELPTTDLSKAGIYVFGNGKTTKVDKYLDVTRLQLAHGANEGYIWASTENNILFLNYVGNTPTSLPPFPLEVTIVY